MGGRQSGRAVWGSADSPGQGFWPMAVNGGGRMSGGREMVAVAMSGAVDSEEASAAALAEGGGGTKTLKTTRLKFPSTDRMVCALQMMHSIRLMVVVR